SGLLAGRQKAKSSVCLQGILAPAKRE
ncbi:hypothetical protein A2U01_0091808, partial [Trifolium medium]|nr:hypothetical protein [Trifolium medium]